MKKGIITIGFMAAAAIMFSSCATIVSGGNPSILITSSMVDEPVTITTSYNKYEKVDLPASVKVKRHQLEGQRIKIESENYKFDDIVLQKAVNSWTFGNILIGGIIGWSVDLMTNAVSKPKQDEFNITPTYRRKKDANGNEKKEEEQDHGVGSPDQFLH